MSEEVPRPPDEATEKHLIAESFNTIRNTHGAVRYTLIKRN